MIITCTTLKLLNSHLHLTLPQTAIAGDQQQKKKKIKRSLENVLHDMLKQIDVTYANICNHTYSTFAMDDEQVKCFFSKMIGAKYVDTVHILSKYTINYDSFNVMKTEIFNHVNNRSLKTRLTTIVNAIRQPEVADPVIILSTYESDGDLEATQEPLIFFFSHAMQSSPSDEAIHNGVPERFKLY